MEEFGNANHQANDDMNKFAHVKASGVLWNEDRRTNRINTGYRKGNLFLVKKKRNKMGRHKPLLQAVKIDRWWSWI